MTFDFQSIGRLWEAADAAERKVLLMHKIREEVIQQVLSIADADFGADLMYQVICRCLLLSADAGA